ncbi:MAG: hypothetical protein PWQ41_1958 [Bacillota bacterium]|nr:hypothetical protein [Bacillota bacterium]MDK2960231.1 hypothetical protein [Bacillota bacterium]
MPYVGPKLITLLQFDNVLTFQEDLRRFPCRVIDLRDIRGTRLLCRSSSLRQIAKRLKGETGITFLGSGDFHYVSYLLLRRLKGAFSLILFDNHADLKPGYTYLACGSWLGFALKLPNLQKAFIIGAQEDGISGINSRLLAKVVYVPYRQAATSEKWHRFPNRLPPIREQGMQKTIRAVISLVPTEAVYVSIDKDVLHEKEAFTNWEQGAMELEELLTALKEIVRAKEVCGVDICGEMYPDPLGLFSPTARKATVLNSLANAKIIEAILGAQILKQAS